MCVMGSNLRVSRSQEIARDCGCFEVCGKVHMRAPCAFCVCSDGSFIDSAHAMRAPSEMVDTRRDT